VTLMIEVKLNLLAQCTHSAELNTSVCQTCVVTEDVFSNRGNQARATDAGSQRPFEFDVLRPVIHSIISILLLSTIYLVLSPFVVARIMRYSAGTHVLVSDVPFSIALAWSWPFIVFFAEFAVLLWLASVGLYMASLMLVSAIRVVWSRSSIKLSSASSLIPAFLQPSVTLSLFHSVFWWVMVMDIPGFAYTGRHVYDAYVLHMLSDLHIIQKEMGVSFEHLLLVLVTVSACASVQYGVHLTACHAHKRLCQPSSETRISGHGSSITSMTSASGIPAHSTTAPWNIWADRRRLRLATCACFALVLVCSGWLLPAEMQAVWWFRGQRSAVARQDRQADLARYSNEAALAGSSKSTSDGRLSSASANVAIIQVTELQYLVPPMQWKLRNDFVSSLESPITQRPWVEGLSAVTRPLKQQDKTPAASAESSRLSLKDHLAGYPQLESTSVQPVLPASSAQASNTVKSSSLPSSVQLQRPLDIMLVFSDSWRFDSKSVSEAVMPFTHQVRRALGNRFVSLPKHYRYVMCIVTSVTYAC